MGRGKSEGGRERREEGEGTNESENPDGLVRGSLVGMTAKREKGGAKEETANSKRRREERKTDVSNERILRKKIWPEPLMFSSTESWNCLGDSSIISSMTVAASERAESPRLACGGWDARAPSVFARCTPSPGPSRVASTFSSLLYGTGETRYCTGELATVRATRTDKRKRSSPRRVCTPSLPPWEAKR